MGFFENLFKKKVQVSSNMHGLINRIGEYVYPANHLPEEVGYSITSTDFDPQNARTQSGIEKALIELFSKQYLDNYYRREAAQSIARDGYSRVEVDSSWYPETWTTEYSIGCSSLNKKRKPPSKENLNNM